MRLREQARLLCGKLSIMADLQVNGKDHKSSSSELLAEEGDEIQNHDTTSVDFVASNTMWKAMQGLEKKFTLLAGRPNSRITDASLKRKMPQTSTAESKNASNPQPDPQKRKLKKLYQFLMPHRTILVMR